MGIFVFKVFSFFWYTCTHNHILRAPTPVLTSDTEKETENSRISHMFAVRGGKLWIYTLYYLLQVLLN
jgi:hypothetical protein